MICVLDSSAAIEIVLDKPQSSALTEQLHNAEWIIAPDIYISEVCNTFWKYYKFHNLPARLCEQYLDLAISLIDDYINGHTLYKETFVLACQAGHSVYDIMYLTVARRHNGVLLTLDAELLKMAKKYSVRTQ